MTAHVLRTELRRSGLPLWIIPLLLAVLGLVFIKTLRSMDGGRFEWSTSIFYNLTPAVVLASTMTLAAAAWRGARERRQSMEELLGSTPRPRWQRALAAWLPMVVWPVLACLPAVLAFGIVSMNAVSGPPMFGVLSAALCTVVAYAALGFAIGSVVPGRFTAPFAGAIVFIVAVGLGASAPHGLLSALPQPTYGTIALNRLNVGLWDRPVWWFAPATALWFTLLTVTLLVLATARRRWVSVVPLILAVLVAAPLVRTEVWRIDTASSLLACSDGEVRVCVPKATGVKLDTVATSTQTVRTHLANLPAVSPQGTAAHTSARTYVWPQSCRVRLDHVGCTSPAEWELHPSSADITLAQRTAGWRCSDSPPATTPAYTSPAPQLENGVRAWLLGNTGDTAPTIAQRIAVMPEHKQRDWLSRYLVAADSCDMSAITGLRLS